MIKTINALILNDKEILLFKKNLTWILPGGKPSYGESDFEALGREFKEEASNAEIRIMSYYGSFIGIPPNTQKILESIVYFSELKKPDLKLVPSREIEEIRFVSYSEANKLKVSDITKKIIDDLLINGYL